MRLDLAQFKELAAFAQIGSDLDKETKERLEQGERVQEIMKQKQYSPMPVEDQVISIFVVNNGYLKDIKLEDIGRFESEFLEFMKAHYPEVPGDIKSTGDLKEDMEKKLRSAVEEFKKNFV